MRSQFDKIKNIAFIKRKVQPARTNKTGRERLFEQRTRRKYPRLGITDEVVVVDL